MILKIFLYVLLVIGPIILQRQYGIIGKEVYAYIIFSIQLGIFPFMLYLEVISRKQKGKNYDEIMKSGFIFSFSVGFFWGILYSYAFSHKGFPLNSLSNVWFLVMYAFCGGVFGLVGMGFTKILCKLMNIPKPSVTGSD
jgi:hypothetical protein